MQKFNKGLINNNQPIQPVQSNVNNPRSIDFIKRKMIEAGRVQNNKEIVGLEKPETQVLKKPDQIPSNEEFKKQLEANRSINNLSRKGLFK